MPVVLSEITHKGNFFCSSSTIVNNSLNLISSTKNASKRNLITSAFCFMCNHSPNNVIKGMIIFFLSSLGMNWSAGQTNRVNPEAVVERVVCSALQFILNESRKIHTHSFIYKNSNKDPFSNSKGKAINSKIPAVFGA